jgi:hypothetical protein
MIISNEVHIAVHGPWIRLPRLIAIGKTTIPVRIDPESHLAIEIAVFDAIIDAIAIRIGSQWVGLIGIKAAVVVSIFDTIFDAIIV